MRQAILLGLLTSAVTALPQPYAAHNLTTNGDTELPAIKPVVGASTKVASQLYVIMCLNINWGEPCYQNWMSPGICCMCYS